MFSTNKAIVSGGGAMVANPISNAISWGLQHAGMPPDVADGLAMVLSGLIVAAMTYFVPNVNKE